MSQCFKMRTKRDIIETKCLCVREKIDVEIEGKRERDRDKVLQSMRQ